jgi:hypothetical protein
MENVLVGLAVLACPVGMGLMMWFMGKGMFGAKRTGGSSRPGSVDELRAEHRRLGAQIEELEGKASRDEDARELAEAAP